MRLFSIKFSFHLKCIFFASTPFGGQVYFWFLYALHQFPGGFPISLKDLHFQIPIPLPTRLRKNYFLDVLPLKYKNNYFFISISTWFPLLTVALTKTITITITTIKIIVIILATTTTNNNNAFHKHIFYNTCSNNN